MEVTTNHRMARSSQIRLKPSAVLYSYYRRGPMGLDALPEAPTENKPASCGVRLKPLINLRTESIRADTPWKPGAGTPSLFLLLEKVFFLGI